MPKVELDYLQSVELDKVWENEPGDFTPWLAEEENLKQLGETLGMELEFEGQELPVGNFRADILCRNTVDGSRVLIENQLTRTDHPHLGQLLTYAAGLDARTVVWIAKEFREEHRAALDRLNEITNESFQYFGIKIKVWQIVGNSARAPQFEIVSSPNNWSRTVSRETRGFEDKDLSEAQRLKQKYWSKLRDYMIQKDTPIKWGKLGHWGDQGFSIGRGNFGLVARQNSRDNFIAIILFMLGMDAKKHFDLLKEQQQQEIEDELGISLEWKKLPEGKQSLVLFSKRDTDPANEVDWQNQHEWLASNLEKFDEVFRPRVKALNADDWEPPEDEGDE
ncbi:MAG: DUF4268 domain-containing protein [Candidatus Poribacteria bacterium]|nr:DUF4268 domain-containing protein [Candidatus Poribacteria bacterium]